MTQNTALAKPSAQDGFTAGFIEGAKNEMTAMAAGTAAGGGAVFAVGGAVAAAGAALGAGVYAARCVGGVGADFYRGLMGGAGHNTACPAASCADFMKGGAAVLNECVLPGGVLAQLAVIGAGMTIHKGTLDKDMHKDMHVDAIKYTSCASAGALAAVASEVMKIGDSGSKNPANISSKSNAVFAAGIAAIVPAAAGAVKSFCSGFAENPRQAGMLFAEGLALSVYGGALIGAGIGTGTKHDNPDSMIAGAKSGAMLSLAAAAAPALARTAVVGAWRMKNAFLTRRHKEKEPETGYAPV